MLKRYLESVWRPITLSWLICYVGMRLAGKVLPLFFVIIAIGCLSCFGILAASIWQFRQKMWFKAVVSAVLFSLTVIALGLPLMWAGALWVGGDSFATTSLQPKQILHPTRQLSDDLLEGKLRPSEVRRATLVKFPRRENESRFSTYRWSFEYPGFPRVEIDGEDRRKLVDAIRNGEPFVSIDRLEVDRAAKSGAWSQEQLIEMAARAEKTHRHDWTERLGMADDRVGGLILELGANRAAFLYVWLADNKAYFEAAGERSSLRGSSAEAYDVLADAFARAKTQPVEVLFPTYNAAAANREAESRFGATWLQSKDYVLKSQEVAAVFGRVLEIRPAKALNSVFTWMDQSAQFTFKIKGDRGEGAVVVWREGSPNNYIAGELITEGQRLELKPLEMPWA